MADTNIVTAKQGDIVDVVPEDHYGGRVTRKLHLFTKIDLGTFSFDRIGDIKRLRPEHWSDGSLHPDSDSVENGTVTIIGKRRFNIPWAELVAKASAKGITIDMNRILDENDDYQPLENTVFTVTDFIKDKVLNRKLTAQDLNKIKQAIK